MSPGPDSTRSSDQPPPRQPEIFVCPMCRQQAPATQTVIMGGRRLCFGCASGWFDDED